MIENLDKEAGNPWFDIGAYMHACTLDMVCGEFFVSCYEKKQHKNTWKKILKIYLFVLISCGTTKYKYEIKSELFYFSLCICFSIGYQSVQ